MTQKEKVELLATVLSQQSESGHTKMFRKWIEQWVRDNCTNWKMKVNNGNLYVTKGKPDPYYPCMVSHIDTVHDICHSVGVHKQGDILFAWDAGKKKQYGIGGDDKVGVFICLMALLELPAVKCVFFRDEEIGCVGSAKADTDFFADCAFALQCDRRGSKDFINDINGMDMYGKEFAAAIKPTLELHGYKENDGMMTDVEQLKKLKINICMANMSCGYYEPHSSTEYVIISHVFNCLNMVLTLCREQHWQQWHHVATFSSYSYGNYSSSAYSKDWDAYWDYDKETKTWREKNKIPKRWKPSDVTWDVAGKCWYLMEMVGIQLYDKMITGDGTFPNPYRLKSKDENWNLTHAYPTQTVVGDTTARHHGSSPENPQQTRCPNCLQVDSHWDAFEEDWFCFTCGMYYNNHTAAHYRGLKEEAKKKAAKKLNGQKPQFPSKKQQEKMLEEARKKVGIAKLASEQAETDMNDAGELHSTRIIRMQEQSLRDMDDAINGTTGTDELK